MMNYAASQYKGDTAFIIKHKDKKNVSYEYIKFEEFRSAVNGFGTATPPAGKVPAPGINQSRAVLPTAAV